MEMADRNEDDIDVLTSFKREKEETIISFRLKTNMH